MRPAAADGAVALLAHPVIQANIFYLLFSALDPSPDCMSVPAAVSFFHNHMPSLLRFEIYRFCTNNSGVYS
jgi:hypothetical protein